VTGGGTGVWLSLRRVELKVTRTNCDFLRATESRFLAALGMTNLKAKARTRDSGTQLQAWANAPENHAGTSDAYADDAYEN